MLVYLFLVARCVPGAGPGALEGSGLRANSNRQRSEKLAGNLLVLGFFAFLCAVEPS
jgi:hypothetical protein